MLSVVEAGNAIDRWRDRRAASRSRRCGLEDA
jgi:hypothetical protein